MKNLGFILVATVSVFVLGCKAKQPNYPTEIINGICFYGIDNAEVNLDDDFRQALFSGKKAEILKKASEVDARIRLRKGTRPVICKVNDEPLTGYFMSLVTNNPQYIGGHLTMYFDDQELKAGEIMLINRK